MARTFVELFRIDGFEGLSMAGRTDQWIFTELAGRHGVATDAATLERIRDTYLTHLRREIHEPGPAKGILPGVEALLDVLSARDDVVVALLTGNIQQGAKIKLEFFDLWRYFPCGGFGDTAADRPGLLVDALAAVEAHSGSRFHGADIVVVGDTPLDVSVAIGAGGHALAVATGSFDEPALREAGAATVLPDLSDIARVMAAIDGGSAEAER
jgi:phosphoglycolate phosphatase